MWKAVGRAPRSCPALTARGVHGVHPHNTPPPPSLLTYPLCPRMVSRITPTQAECVRSGKVSSLTRVMGWHPRYLHSFLNGQNFIMREEGPLPLPWRNFIAIMAASR